MNGKYVAFGQIVEGEGVLDKLEAVGTADGVPNQKVFITDCGLA